MTRPARDARNLSASLRAELRARASLYLVWLVWFAVFFLLARATLSGPDGTRYLAHLRSLVFDRDLVLVNELTQLGQRVIITSTGYSAQIANIGIIPFWLPFYLLGAAAAWLSGAVGSGLEPHYQLWLDFGDWVYGLLAMLAIYRLVSRRRSPGTALAATLLATLGTSYVYYMTALAPSYHMVAVLLVTLALLLWDSTRVARSGPQWFVLGLLIGFLVSIAQYHVVLLVFPASDVLRRLRGVAGERPSPRAVAAGVKSLAGALAMVPGIILPLLPQFIVWAAVYGSPFANPYTLEADWGGAHFFDVLFSSYHGLFFTAPALLLAVGGWIVGLRSDRALSLGAFVALVGIAYSSSTRIGWWAGVSFGARYFVGLTPLFAIGFASLLGSINLPWFRRLIWLGGAAGALWTYGYFLQAFTGLTSFSEYHPAEQWMAQQLAILRNPVPVLSAHWLLRRPPSLLANLPWLLLTSFIAVRLFGARLPAAKGYSAPRWGAVLSCVPLGFAVFLLMVIPVSEAQIASLASSGYYARNQARGEFDWEQFSNEYVERARYFGEIGKTDAARSDLARAVQLWPDTSRRMAGDDEQQTFVPTTMRFGTDITLLGYRFDPSEIVPGSPLTVTLLWRAGRRLPADYDSGVLLLDTRGEIVSRTAPKAGVDSFPATWWLPGELMSDRHVIDTKAIPSATALRVRAEMFDAQVNRRLAAPGNGVFGEIRAPAPVSARMPEIATLGDQISLVSFGLERGAQGVRVRLSWQALATPTDDYTVFVHLLDEQGRMLAQSDGQPVAGRYPTHAWRSGEVISDEHVIALDPAKQATLRQIAVGMYRLSDGRRLAVRGGGDAVILQP